MKIGNIFGGQADPALLSKRTEATEAAATVPTKAVTAGAADSTPSAMLREILAKYDVSNVTPADFSQMIQKLYQAGALSPQEYQDLGAIRTDLDATGHAPDEPVNLLEIYRDKVKRAQREADDADPAARPQLAPLLGRLDWLEKFSAMHAQPDSIGLSAVA